MPLTFNETVPTITDMLEYCEVDPKHIHSIISDDCISDFIAKGPKCPYLNDIVLSDIESIIINLNKYRGCSLENMNRFRKMTNSKYIVWM